MTSTTSSSTPSSTSVDTKNASATPPAQRVSLAQLAACGQRLREGRLVAFPTETVYGLGCHALDEAACMAVFAAKERPLTDPLIVHVHEATAAFGLWEATADDDDDDNNLQRRVLHSLAGAFWPGPLTLVARASHAVPAVVMAGTGYCAARCPQHPVALALLEAAAVPVAAPSANKFGHVSPTTAQHVWDDLQAEDVWILEAQEEDLAQQGGDKGSPHKDSTSCHVGVESSVAKLEMDQATDGAFPTTGRLTVLRQGAVSVQDLQQALAAAGLGDAITVVAQSTARVALTTASVAPGQSIRHYSPHVPSYLLSASCCGVTTPSARILAQAVVLDYGSQLVGWQSSALAYRDTSPTACAAEAAQGIYQTLRWAEQVPEARYILFAPPVSSAAAADQPADALLLAVQDRLQRAASGVVLDSLEELEVSSTSLEQ